MIISQKWCTSYDTKLHLIWVSNSKDLEIVEFFITIPPRYTLTCLGPIYYLNWAVWKLLILGRNEIYNKPREVDMPLKSINIFYIKNFIHSFPSLLFLRFFCFFGNCKKKFQSLSFFLSFFLSFYITFFSFFIFEINLFLFCIYLLLPSTSSSRRSSSSISDFFHNYYPLY